MSASAAILVALGSGVHRTRAIAKHIGLPRHTVQIRVSELVRYRWAHSYSIVFTTARRKVGRPEKVYLLRNAA